FNELIKERKGKTYFKHVKGHSGVYENEQADRLAYLGSKNPDIELVRHTINYSVYPQELTATRIIIPLTKKGKQSYVEFTGDQLPYGVKCVCTGKSIRKPLSKDIKGNYYCVSPYNRGEKLIAVRKWEVGTRKCDK
ncbi:17817_t:CDS:2, partial [Cetraspora pellucida]